MEISAHDNYDDIPYPGYAYPQTHPDRLATVALLFDMGTQPVEHCRVLELGCGDGANLIPMALGLPESQFVGVDLAGDAIARGREIVEALGLKNVALLHLDVMEIGPGFGEFDYIIAHGLYSWVPPEVQEKALAICDVNLAAKGVAYVSYNAYPGCHLREMLREMMLFHVRTCEQPRERINQARAFVKFLADSGSSASSVLKDELEQIMNRRGEVLFHDDLAEVNSPLYFYQFAQRAARHGLQYLAEADFFEMHTGAFSQQTLDALSQIGESQVILKEQYLDFLKCRRFRQTLLCHHEVPINRTLNPAAVSRLYVAASAPPASAEPDIRSASVEEFRTAKGTTIAMDHPLGKAAMLLLSEIWPQPLHFSELLEKAQALAGHGPSRNNGQLARGAGELAEILLRLYATGVVELHTRAPQFAARASERPRASELARLQARRDRVVTNLCHVNIKFEDEIGRWLLQLLDGSRDRAALLSELIAFAESSGVDLQQDGAKEAPIINANELERNLAKLARLALLVS